MAFPLLTLIIAFLNPIKCGIIFSLFELQCVFNFAPGGGGFTQPIPGNRGADQLCGVTIIGQLLRDGTRGPEYRGIGPRWPDA